MGGEIMIHDLNKGDGKDHEIILQESQIIDIGWSKIEK